MTGLGYATVTQAAEAAPAAASQTQIDQGRQLYLEGCATCHGLAAQGTNAGPGLIGVGAAAVDFQVSTGRMPLAAPAVQAVRRTPTYTPDQVAALAAFVASLGPGPAIPSAQDVSTADANLAEGGELFRTNCAQCHNFAGKGGALSDGKFAPSLMVATPTEIFEAMLTGPQNMPNFPNSTLPVEKKQAIIKYIEHLQNSPDPGGLALGSYGPVTEGVFIWTAGIGAVLLAAVWIGAKVR
ncbi:MAG: c-type cytochrome [Frankiales bacterium]|nr:c-type cytochrome [Frankiales bacterium]